MKRLCLVMSVFYLIAVLSGMCGATGAMNSSETVPLKGYARIQAERYLDEVGVSFSDDSLISQSVYYYKEKDANGNTTDTILTAPVVRIDNDNGDGTKTTVFVAELQEDGQASSIGGPGESPMGSGSDVISSNGYYAILSATYYEYNFRENNPGCRLGGSAYVPLTSTFEMVARSASSSPLEYCGFETLLKGDRYELNTITLVSINYEWYYHVLETHMPQEEREYKVDDYALYVCDDEDYEFGGHEGLMFHVYRTIPSTYSLNVVFDTETASDCHATFVIAGDDPHAIDQEGPSIRP